MGINVRQYFPLGKAYGEAFCNRIEETKRLVSNIKSGKHTLIVAPRRYGKSSLAERAIQKSGYPSVKLNFHLCTSEEEIAQLVLDSVIKLIGKSIGHVEKLITSIKKYLTNLEPLLSFGNEHVNLKLVPKKEINFSVMISEALLLLEKLLSEKNKKAVLFMDEFQEISKISKHKSIEGAIRTAAQETSFLSIIFSGSIRSILLSMFEDESRPLYKLCRKIKLERISSEDYYNHIQKIAHATWKKKINEDVFNKLMELSNRHPYYVNYLADSIWENTNQLPTISDVEQSWHRVIMEEWSDALRELSDLPMGQRRVLKYIAKQDAKKLQSQETSTILAMPASSIATSINALVEKDYVEHSNLNNYKIINPLLNTVLQGISDSNES